jgi:hypothetical protein
MATKAIVVATADPPLFSLARSPAIADPVQKERSLVQERKGVKQFVLRKEDNKGSKVQEPRVEYVRRELERRSKKQTRMPIRVAFCTNSERC